VALRDALLDFCRSSLSIHSPSQSIAPIDPLLRFLMLKSPQSASVIASINTTPLVDVILVLLIIFLITVPVVNSSSLVSLPKERAEQLQTRPESIIISVKQNGEIYLSNTQINHLNVLFDLLVTQSKTAPSLEIQIKGDKDTPYERIGRVLQTCQRAGIRTVSFVTEPPAEVIPQP
jgi:biopolymer transport protein ExbD